MEIAINGKIFAISFSNDPDGHKFTLSDGKNSSTHRISYASNWSIAMHMAKTFDITETQINNLHSGLIWKIYNAYETWYRERKKCLETKDIQSMEKDTQKKTYANSGVQHTTN
jgi:hypothetical protein